MAKYLASDLFRSHPAELPHPRRHGYSKEYEIERLMRDAPFLLIGEGTSEIEKNIISKRLLAEYRI